MVALYRDGGRRKPWMRSTGSGPTMQLVLGEITVVGNLIGTNTDLAELVTLAEQGKVQLHSSRYPLEFANDAIDDLRQGRLRGRGILVPG